MGGNLGNQVFETSDGGGKREEPRFPFFMGNLFHKKNNPISEVTFSFNSMEYTKVKPIFFPF